MMHAPRYVRGYSTHALALRVRTRAHHAHEHLATTNPRMSDIEAEFDEIITSAPAHLFEPNYYYYRNFSEYRYVTHHVDSFEHYIALGSLAESGSYYVASFDEHLLLTRVGIRTKVMRGLTSSLHFRISAFGGNNPYDHLLHRTVLLEYVNFRPPANRFHSFLENRRATFRIDTGQNTRIRVKPRYQLELELLNKNSPVVFENTEVFVRVQAAKAVGGIEDHPTWFRKKYDKTVSVVSESKYRKYMESFESVCKLT